MLTQDQTSKFLDSIVAQGWGPAFVCGRVLECAQTASMYRKLKRDEAFSYERHALWYYHYLVDKSRDDLKMDKTWGRPWTLAYTKLLTLLSPEEMELLDTEIRCTPADVW